MREAIRRILSSQKAIYAMIPVLANTVAGLAGVDPTQPLLLTLDAVFALLLLVQFALDMRWGSPSDGSGAFRNIAPLLLAGLFLAGCTTQVGSEGRWFKGSLADGFCVSAAAAGLSGSLGHCGDADGGTPDEEDCPGEDGEE